MLGPDDLSRLTGFRHALHRRPELSGTESETARAVVAFTAETRPDAVLGSLGGHGVALVYDSGTDGPGVLLRAELDALPIAELPGRAHRSQVPGRGHLCGHDGHMAILAGVALLLGRRRPARGRAIVLFQPAEETGAGAAAVLNDPRFADLRPDWAFALHNMPGVALGTVAVGAGPANCASCGLRVVLSGRTAHAATPCTGVSPAASAARLALALPGLGPGGALVDGFRHVTLCHLRVGEATFGIAPGEAELWLTLRTVTDDALGALERALRATIQAEASDEGLDVTITRSDHFPACINDGDAVRVFNRAIDAAGLVRANAERPMRASEDFGRFGHHARAAMALLGAGHDCPALHSPDYDFPDALITPGVALFSGVVDDLMGWKTSAV